MILLTNLVPEEFHISSQVFPQVSVEGVPVRADDLAVKTGVHPGGGDWSEGGEILIMADNRLINKDLVII